MTLIPGRLTLAVLAAALIGSSCSSCDSGGTGRAPLQTARGQASPSVALAGCPPPAAAAALPVVARPGASPDDIAVLPSGAIWVTDDAHGSIRLLAPSGAPQLTLSDPAQPEGVVALADGRVVVAEAATGRIVAYRPPSRTPTVLAVLANTTGRPGMDGLAFDPAGNRLLIPDSPHGSLVALPLSGGPPVTLATGLGRPVAAAVGPGGNLFVAAETTGNGLFRVPPRGGAPVAVGRFAQLDDVVSDGRLLYVTDITNHTLDAVDPSGGDLRVLVTGLQRPEGLAALSDGRLMVADEPAGTVAVTPGCNRPR